MARAQRLATIIAAIASLYALLFFAVLPVPFVDEDVVVQILPTVRGILNCDKYTCIGIWDEYGAASNLGKERSDRI